MTSITHPTPKRKLKMVGAFMPPYIHEFVTLYALAKETTKAKILTNLVEPWVEMTRRAESDNDLITQIIQRVNLEWKVERMSNPNANFETFKKSVEYILKEKGIKPSYVLKILTEIKNGKREIIEHPEKRKERITQ